MPKNTTNHRVVGSAVVIVAILPFGRSLPVYSSIPVSRYYLYRLRAIYSAILIRTPYRTYISSILSLSLSPPPPSSARRPVRKVKSLRPVSLFETRFDKHGLVNDRRLMIVRPDPRASDHHHRDRGDGESPASHRFLTQRQSPSLATIEATEPVDITTTTSSSVDDDDDGGGGRGGGEWKGEEEDSHQAIVIVGPGLASRVRRRASVGAPRPAGAIPRRAVGRRRGCRGRRRRGRGVRVGGRMQGRSEFRGRQGRVAPTR